MADGVEMLYFLEIHLLVDLIGGSALPAAGRIRSYARVSLIAFKVPSDQLLTNELPHTLGMLYSVPPQ